MYVCVPAKSLQPCLTLCDSVVCSLPGSPVHGILQARILEWVARSLLQGIFLTQGSNLLHWFAGSLPLTTWETLALFPNRNYKVINHITFQLSQTYKSHTVWNALQITVDNLNLILSSLTGWWIWRAEEAEEKCQTMLDGFVVMELTGNHNVDVYLVFFCR